VASRRGLGTLFFVALCVAIRPLGFSGICRSPPAESLRLAPAESPFKQTISLCDCALIFVILHARFLLVGGSGGDRFFGDGVREHGQVAQRAKKIPPRVRAGRRRADCTRHQRLCAVRLLTFFANGEYKLD